MNIDYTKYSTADFAADPYFIKWLKNPDEKAIAFWEAWIISNPEKFETVSAAKTLIEGWVINPEVSANDAMAEVWSKIQDQIAEEEKPEGLIIKLISKPNFFKYAASFVGLLCCIGLYVMLFQRTENTVIVTHEGETKSVRLPDGSTVVLNSNSSIEWSGAWKPQQAREVTLTGEGYFSVTHQQNHQKFIVKTPDKLKVEVLGTEFTVSEKINKTRVVLNSGKVKLYLDNDDNSLIMKPGELVEVSNDAGREVTRRNVVPEVYSTWKDNLFVFDNTPLLEVASMIESDFGYKVKFADDSLKSRKITIKLPKRDLSLLLVSISEMLDLKIEKQKNRILIAQNPAVR
ncbi:ferric-dicitrate binding protein FerR, regulates iron transport through sigma-19 [Pseudarcicella hirudinis]|uniref:Ferric-dicitrate binding protein FerR, regulates iron transport through sigma-19 n=1 Tax=Pseudarcicella hirudinis TaxID=1079859 RepID=A0A1I5TS90_9BACT|nr:FecR domain-containing protein [Pseudarcicella hirudinis]SFP85858.1 ferric-dicitrate binding protein FerR, regulates iron transport through sigma-19 [Pseudarcicella hirudinis]